VSAADVEVLLHWCIDALRYEMKIKNNNHMMPYIPPRSCIKSLTLLSTSFASALETCSSTGFIADRRLDLGVTQLAKLQLTSAVAIAEAT
jgi:hypothetical protein